MSTPAKIGLIAGQGDLPFLLRDALIEQSRDLFILAIHGDAKPELTDNMAHQWIEMNEIARTMEIFREEGVEEIVMAGKLSRPSIKALKPPALAAKILKRIGAAFFKGDDALFKAIVSIFEEEGFRIIGADDILQELLTPKGVLTEAEPTADQLKDCEIAINAAKALGAKDIGQAVVVLNGEVIAEEDDQGTDAMLNKLNKSTCAGAILAKAKKPNQERRVDLPTIGPQTIEKSTELGIAGIVLEAEQSLILDRPNTLKLANLSSLFILGF